MTPFTTMTTLVGVKKIMKLLKSTYMVVLALAGAGVGIHLTTQLGAGIMDMAGPTLDGVGAGAGVQVGAGDQAGDTQDGVRTTVMETLITVTMATLIMLQEEVCQMPIQVEHSQI